MKNFIFGQGLPEVANLKYGNYTIRYNGCELVAIYNALVNLDAPRDFKDIIASAEKMKGVKWSLFWLKSVFGTKPKGIGRLLEHYGRKITASKKRRNFSGMLLPGGTYIVTFFNGHIWQGIHTVMFVCDGDSGIRVFNHYDNDKKAREYESLDKFLAGKGRPVILYKVE